jgi:hypothetical protein
LSNPGGDNDHHVLRVKAVIKKPGKKENRGPLPTDDSQVKLDRQSYITKYASLKEMELEYIN